MSSGIGKETELETEFEPPVVRDKRRIDPTTSRCGAA